MGDFSFTATAECHRCGAYLSSSDADCDSCNATQLRRFYFDRIGGDVVQTVWAVSPIRAWAELHKQDVDSIHHWRLRHRVMSLDYLQAGYDVTDSDELRQNA